MKKTIIMLTAALICGIIFAAPSVLAQNQPFKAMKPFFQFVMGGNSSDRTELVKDTNTNCYYLKYPINSSSFALSPFIVNGGPYCSADGAAAKKPFFVAVIGDGDNNVELLKDTNTNCYYLRNNSSSSISPYIVGGKTYCDKNPIAGDTRGNSTTITGPSTQVKNPLEAQPLRISTSGTYTPAVEINLDDIDKYFEQQGNQDSLKIINNRK